MCECVGFGRVRREWSPPNAAGIACFKMSLVRASPRNLGFIDIRVSHGFAHVGGSRIGNPWGMWLRRQERRGVSRGVSRPMQARPDPLVQATAAGPSFATSAHTWRFWDQPTLNIWLAGLILISSLSAEQGFIFLRYGRRVSAGQSLSLRNNTPWPALISTTRYGDTVDAGLDGFISRLIFDPRISRPLKPTPTDPHHSNQNV